jgi:hypothetical protein
MVHMTYDIAKFNVCNDSHSAPFIYCAAICVSEIDIDQVVFITTVDILSVVIASLFDHGISTTNIEQFIQI